MCRSSDLVAFDRFCLAFQKTGILSWLLRESCGGRCQGERRDLLKKRHYLGRYHIPCRFAVKCPVGSKLGELGVQRLKLFCSRVYLRLRLPDEPVPCEFDSCALRVGLAGGTEPPGVSDG